jgi:hypothetical protein
MVVVIRMMCGEGTRFVWEGTTPSAVPIHALSALLDHTVRMGMLLAVRKDSTQHLDPLCVATSPPPAPQVPMFWAHLRVSSVPVGHIPAKSGGLPHAISVWTGHTQLQEVH